MLRDNVSNLDKEGNEAAALLASVRIGEAENRDLKMALKASQLLDAKKTVRIGELERQMKDIENKVCLN